ncbi:MAG: CDP-alcohol phosphatidyltransferase family protein [Pseudomonadota bacterium]|nr:CDP-alcohol phosphatidyltransferase family protein [Pseudomonadota bacterium]
MLPNLITGLRLALLVPLYLSLTQGDNPERWAALGLYLFAGLTDVLDGRIARATGQTSLLGHALDRMADGLLTLVAVFGLLESGVIHGWAAAAGLVVIGRGFVVSGLEVAYPDRLNITVNWLEKIKIGLQFMGLSLLMAPWAPGIDAHAMGGWVLVACAGMTLVTLADYIWRAVRAARTE